MRKIISIIAAVMMALALTACGNPSPAPADTTDGENKQENEVIDQGGEGLTPVFSATINETVLVDEKDVKITATELTYTGYSAELELLIENNSDRDLSFYAGTLGYSVNSVNHYMIADGYLGEDVDAGMQARPSVSFSLDQLMMYGITDIADIGLGIEIKDGYDEYLITGPIEIPTSIADTYDYDKDTFREAMNSKALAKEYGFVIDYYSDDALFDESGMKVLSSYVITNEDGKQGLLLEVINQSDKIQYAIAADSVLNGIAVSDYGDSELVVPGKRAVLDITFDGLLEQSYLKLLGMKEYSDYACTFEVAAEDGTTLAGKDIQIVFGKTGATETFTGETLYDANGYTIQNVGLVEDSSSYSDDLHLLLLVKNGSSQTVSVDNGFNDAYVNKMKTTVIMYSKTVKPGQTGLLDIELMESDLESNNLTLSDITEISLKLDVRDDDYMTVDEPEMKITY